MVDCARIRAKLYKLKSQMVVEKKELHQIKAQIVGLMGILHISMVIYPRKQTKAAEGGRPKNIDSTKSSHYALLSGHIHVLPRKVYSDF